MSPALVKGAGRAWSPPEAPPDPQFERRRQLLLWVAIALIGLLSLSFALRFGLQGQQRLAQLQLGYLGVALGAAWLLHAGLVRDAALFLVLASALGIAVNAWWADLPQHGTPRTLHLYLIPLLLLARFWLSREPRLLRSATSASLLLLLGLLCVLDNPFVQPLVLPPGEHRRLAWAVPVLAAVLFALLTRLQELDLHDQLRLELDLATALAEDELSLHFQPQCDAAGRPFGAEALVRWEHPRLGAVSPARFVALAERSGLILALGEQVARKACAFAARCQRQPGLRDLSIAINVSAAQFQDEAAFERLLQTVQAAQLPAGSIKFELTESLIVQDLASLRARLARCQAAGIRTALDDFGTGHASLASLRGLPFDQLKIDQGFVKNLGRHARAEALAQSVIQLGRELGLEVVAEGVETAEHLALLQGMGCSRFQGYWFARPLQEDEALAWLQRRRATESTPA
ncbi:putative bifunctional diguanylate cyclase/phosphodiesterase [Inhella proteolytica]|uniref:EAL domain-containing protein n=1 Tax=Inhella proteolytica TaxID=2795029 RepID=A0A931J113_9BURK|nr:EAL domain-containing protein [Inhella proteolytica]MBH9576758.1 EAL domain-containing protein [Inhella proteolytica]